MKKHYIGLNRTSFKLRTYHETTIVDEKNRRVICTIHWELIAPKMFYDFMWCFCRQDLVIRGVAKGVAVCSEEDVFNAELGTKVARAIAESNMYTSASKRLEKRMFQLRNRVINLDMMSADFDFKARSVKIHNSEYIDSIV